MSAELRRHALPFPLADTLECGLLEMMGRLPDWRVGAGEAAGRGHDKQNNPQYEPARPNVEVTGAARLYRAASVWTAGLGPMLTRYANGALRTCEARYP